MDSANEVEVEGSIRGSDFLQLNVGGVPRGGRAVWLADQVRTAIVEGRLGEGQVLPASRVLAADLGVSRGVVTDAYRRLADDGSVVGEGRRGTIVCAVPSPSVARTAATGPAGLERDVRGSADDFAALRAAHAEIDLSPGMPDLAAFPRSAWLRAERAVLDSVEHRDLGYSDPRGTRALRNAVCTWVGRTRGIRVEPDEVQIVAGVAQAIALFATLLREEGTHSVAVEDPCSLGARQQLEAWNIRTRGIPIDDAGIDVRKLTATGERVVMSTPAHQFPTGVVLSGARRQALTEWVQPDGLIFEDDYDAEHRYDRPPVAAIRATLPDHVFYAGSVSKTLAPALRIGWVLAPPRWRRKLAAFKRDTDLGNATLPQLVLAHLMTSGDLERHLRHLRRRHRQRRDVMIAALAKHLPGGQVQGAAAGLHLTVLLPHGTDDLALAANCLAAGVKVHPLTWHRIADGRPGLVLGYAASSPANITRGIDTLSRILNADSGSHSRTRTLA